MKRSRLGPGRAALERGSTFSKPRTALQTKKAPGRPKRRPPRPEHVKAASAAWIRDLGPCVMCPPALRSPAKGHHIITQQELGHVATELGVDVDVLLWDRRNRLALCEACHTAHHHRVRPVPLAVVFRHAPEVFDFAEEINRSWYLERTYPDV